MRSKHHSLHTFFQFAVVEHNPMQGEPKNQTQSCLAFLLGQLTSHQHFSHTFHFLNILLVGLCALPPHIPFLTLKYLSIIQAKAATPTPMKIHEPVSPPSRSGITPKLLFSCIISYATSQGICFISRYLPVHQGGILFVLWLTGAFHIVDSGHIAIYKRGGALLNSWSEPGLHFMVPVVTDYHLVQVTLQTDKVKNIPVKILICSVVPAVV